MAHSAPRLRRRASIINTQAFGANPYTRKMYALATPVTEIYMSQVPHGGRHSFGSSVNSPSKRGFSPEFFKSNPLFYLQEPIETRNFNYHDFENFGDDSDNVFETSFVDANNENEAIKRAFSSRTLDSDPFGVAYRSVMGPQKRSWPDAKYLDENYFKTSL